MFQIDSFDDKRTRWILNETPIIIPLGDEESLPKEPNAIVKTVNVISENEDQKSLEHDSVFGLDKNLFGEHIIKTDLLIIQDSDMQLFSCNPDVKNEFGYSLSFVNQGKTEPLRSNIELKDRPKEWSNENAILGVKDILMYDEKSNQKVNLQNSESESKSYTSKVRNVQKEEIIGKIEEEQKNEDFQLIINCIPECYAISSKKKLENCELLHGHVKSNGNIFKKIVRDCNHLRVSSNNFIDFNMSSSENATELPKVKQNNVTFPEKSLPLKKKAKIKMTTMPFNTQRSLLKQQSFKSNQSHEKSSFESKGEKQLYSLKQDCNFNNSEKSLLNKINKKKSQNISKKFQKVVSNSLAQRTKGGNLKSEKDLNLRGFDVTKFQNIYDLVEGLRKYRMISVPIWQLLNTGLREMNVDILKEIIKKRKEPEGRNYSPQLKAFALVIYFKQPVAFNFLAKVCKGGWPSLNVIKEWKLQLNSHHRPNFIGLQKKIENVS